ncbi:hypothetical protein Fcan01_16471 [Folsomia candida]|uniref:Uncharacterized protein n=1 Tax=Folsomia candida TaxID=158441 RepID=A0A226DTA5_FOLCA|nr:hypothetical protein Fcan01_16471 [Folsomia candida]
MTTRKEDTYHGASFNLPVGEGSHEVLLKVTGWGFSCLIDVRSIVAIIRELLKHIDEERCVGVMEIYSGKLVMVAKKEVQVVCVDVGAVSSPKLFHSASLMGDRFHKYIAMPRKWYPQDISPIEQHNVSQCYKVGKVMDIEFHSVEEEKGPAAGPSKSITQYNELGHHVNQFLDGIGDECRHIWTTYNNRWTATRLGDPLQIEREIQLYGKSFFQDVPYKVKGSIPSIIPPLKVRSFYFSGNYSWGLFTGPKFTGDTICFLPRIEGREWGITAFSMFVFPVKSVEEGC